MGYKVAVVGATGNVGREILNILAERHFPIDKIVALASRRSLGTELSFGDEILSTKDLEQFDFSGWDIALFAVGSEATKLHAPRAAKVRKWCILFSLWLSFLLYTSLTSTIMRAFRCEDFETGAGEARLSRLLVDYSIDCDSRYYRYRVVPWAAVCFVIYVAGTPALYFALLFRERGKLGRAGADEALLQFAARLEEKAFPALSS